MSVNIDGNLTVNGVTQLNGNLNVVSADRISVTNGVLRVANHAGGPGNPTFAGDIRFENGRHEGYNGAEWRNLSGNLAQPTPLTVIAGSATPADIPDGCAMVYFNSANNRVMISYNDGGVMRHNS